MSTFDVEKTRVKLFDFGDIYLFKEYFDDDQLFNQLEKYYNQERYRFETPEEELSKISKILEKFFYDPEIVHQAEKYCVVTKKTETEDILRSAILRQHHSNYEVFVMKDKPSVRQAVEQGAKPVEKAGVEIGDIQWHVP